jgi:RNA polymerase sigma-70 factor (ECF subfamily)
VAEKLLAEAIALLPDKQKQVFLLRYYDELSYQDISEICGTSVGALKASYHHAAQKIENYILNKSN